MLFGQVFSTIENLQQQFRIFCFLQSKQNPHKNSSFRWLVVKMLQHGLVNKAHILLHLCFCDQLFGFSGQTTNCTTIALGCCTPSSCRIFNLTVLYAVKECYLFLIGACTCSSSCLPPLSASSPFWLLSPTDWISAIVLCCTLRINIFLFF